MSVYVYMEKWIYGYMIYMNMCTYILYIICIHMLIYDIKKPFKKMQPNLIFPDTHICL